MTVSFYEVFMTCNPLGLPMLAVWGLGKLQGANAAMKNSSIVKAQAGAFASACFSKIAVYFLANLGYNISKKGVVA